MLLLKPDRIVSCRVFLYLLLYIFTMALLSFKDWLAANESTARTRARKAAALEIGPSIPDAGIHSHSTAKPWEVEKIKERNKKDSKKKSNGGKKEKTDD